jgi:hypothetical protein
MFQVELVEGKDQPRHFSKPHDQLGKTVGLLIRLTEPIHRTGKVVILDSGFCVLKGIVELKKRSVYSSALIKKRRYWPKYINGDAIKLEFGNREVGDSDGLPGELDGVPFHVFAMKEPDYVMMLMSTYGTLETHSQRETSRCWKDSNGAVKKKNFKYPEVMDNHFLFRHAVDDHNLRRHAPISFEEVWGTKRWANRVFAFLLAVTEVNVLLASIKLYGEKYPGGQVEFRKKFAKELINNPYFEAEAEARPRRSERNQEQPSHRLVHLPRKSKFAGTQIVGSKCDYPQFACRGGCGKRVRTYCFCSPGTIICNDCFVTHTVNCDAEAALQAAF